MSYSISYPPLPPPLLTSLIELEVIESALGLCVFGYFGGPDTRNWKSSDAWVPVNNFVKAHNPKV